MLSAGEEGRENGTNVQKSAETLQRTPRSPDLSLSTIMEWYVVSKSRTLISFLS
jgi:hypothetical protein